MIAPNRTSTGSFAAPFHRPCQLEVPCLKWGWSDGQLERLVARGQRSSPRQDVCIAGRGLYADAPSSSLREMNGPPLL